MDRDKEQFFWRARLCFTFHKLYLTAWILGFLTTRPQHVKLGNVMKENCVSTVVSNTILTNTATKRKIASPIRYTKALDTK